MNNNYSATSSSNPFTATYILGTKIQKYLSAGDYKSDDSLITLQFALIELKVRSCFFFKQLTFNFSF